MTNEVEQYPMSPQAEPATLEEALARLNFTPERAWRLCVSAKWGFVPDDREAPYEYDQGDRLTVDYDDLHNVASIALAALKLLGGGTE